MANLTVLKNTTATLANIGWTSGAVPDSQDIAVIGSAASGLTSISAYGTASPNASALQVASDYTSSVNRIDIDDPTNNTAIYRLYNQAASGQKINGVYSLYIADGKTLGLGQRLQLRGPNATQATNRWFIGAGAALILNPSNSTSRFGDVYQGDFNGASLGYAMRIVKEGAGYAYIARSTSATNTGSFLLGGYTIRDGEIRLDGFSSVTPLGATVSGVADSNTLIFDPDSVSAQPTLRFVVNQTSARTITNPVTVNTRGAITVEGAFVATMSGAASGSGTLTIARTSTGSVTWNNNISCPLNVTGLLTMAESRNLSGTLSGIGGTIAMSGGTISGDAPTFTGDVTGAFTYNASGGKTFGGNAQGTVTVTGGTLTATASNSGTIANISGGAGVTLSSNGTFTGDLTGYTYLGQLPTAGVATFSMVGSTATFARNLSLTNGSNVRLSNSATLASPIVVTNITSNTSSMTVEDATTNTFTGSYISDGSAGSDNVSVKTGGTLVVSGSIDGRRSDRVWNLNNADGYAGTIRITGVGFYNSLGNAPTAAPAFLKRGKIQFARAGVSYLAGGLTIESGSTIACAASNAAYAAQLSGNLTLSAGSFMKFGTA